MPHTHPGAPRCVAAGLATQGESQEKTHPSALRSLTAILWELPHWGCGKLMSIKVVMEALVIVKFSHLVQSWHSMLP